MLRPADVTKHIDEAPAAGVRRHASGLPGLYLVVGRGRAYWSLQFRSSTAIPRKDGKPACGWSSKGFGSAATVTPKQARDLAMAFASARRSGITGPTVTGPVMHMPRQARTAAVGVTFPTALEAWLTAKASEWRSPRAVPQRRAGLSKLSLTTMNLAAITKDDVLSALADLTPRQHEDHRSWLRDLFSWCKVKPREWIGENPAAFDDDEVRHFAKHEKGRNHHAAMPWSEVPALMSTLGQSDACKALGFAILTAVRTGDVEGATWADVTGDVWTIPVAKNGKPLRVPLTAAARKLLGKPAKDSSAKLFDLSKNKMLDCLKEHASNATVHGMRSAFRDWVGETLHADKDIAEMCLGHAVGGAVERAYARSDLLKLRRELLEKWSAFATGR